MKQINNGFLHCYYMLENGKVLNEKTGNEIKPTRNNYQLITLTGERKTISLKRLYSMVFNRVFCVDEIENLPNEEWKEIAECEGNYFISNLGRVKSL